MTKDIRKEPDALSPHERASARDAFVRSFEQQFSNWVSIAKCCVDMKRDKDYEILGYATLGQYLVDAAPRSRSYIYLVMGRYEELAPDIPEKELEQIPLGSAGILKQLSSAERKKSNIRLAAKLKPSELRKVIQAEAPGQHIEALDPRTLRFTESQAVIFDEMIEAYGVLHEAESTAEEAVEWLCSQWLDSSWEDSPHSNRQRAAQMKASA